MQTVAMQLVVIRKYFNFNQSERLSLCYGSDLHTFD